MIDEEQTKYQTPLRPRYGITEPAEPFRRFCWTCHGFKEHRDGEVVLPAQCQQPDACGK